MLDNGILIEKIAEAFIMEADAATDYSYYLIAPSKQLIEHATSTGAEWSELILERHLYSRYEPAWGEVAGNVRNWHELRSQQLKAMFLISLKVEYLGKGKSEPKNDFQEFVYKLLDMPNLRVNTFERWWTLERIDCLDDDFEKAIHRIPKNEWTIFSNEDQSLSEWIQSLR